MFTGDLAGGLFPAVPLTPVRPPAAASRHRGESDAVGGGPSGTPDLSREGPFDVHQDGPCSTSSPQLLHDNQGCQFRMTSYDEGTDGPNFAPEYGVQRLLEYVGAPESARLTSRSPEYWIHHMGREKALSAALQLQHDAGLVLCLTVKNSRRSCATIGERMNSQHGLIFGRNKVGSIASHSQRSQVSRGAVLCGLN